MGRLRFTIRKTLWYWLYVGEWSWPQTHWRKWGEYRAWLTALEEQDG